MTGSSADSIHRSIYVSRQAAKWVPFRLAGCACGWLLFLLFCCYFCFFVIVSACLLLFLFLFVVSICCLCYFFVMLITCCLMFNTFCYLFVA